MANTVNENCNFFNYTERNIDNDIYIHKIEKKNLLLKIKKTKIENVLMLVKIIPFLKDKISIIIKISKNLYPFFKKTFKNQKFKNNIIKFNNQYFKYLINDFKNLFDYDWELIPKLDDINRVRYVISNYYNEFCLKIFDNYLNYNLNIYILNNKYLFTIEDIYKLMSKCFKNIY